MTSPLVEHAAWLSAAYLNHRKRTDPTFVRSQILDDESYYDNPEYSDDTEWEPKGETNA